MNPLTQAGRACMRALAALVVLFRQALRAVRLLFILALVLMPVPLVLFLASVLEPVRRNLPAEVLRKKKR
ncbi:hypothetical protein P2318_04680 [Myxococcaceae bacterium GXIMD 01537]